MIYMQKEGLPMLTEFGKALRKIRIDRQQLLRDMLINWEYLRHIYLQ